MRAPHINSIFFSDVQHNAARGQLSLQGAGPHATDVPVHTCVTRRLLQLLMQHIGIEEANMATGRDDVMKVGVHIDALYPWGMSRSSHLPAPDLNRCTS